MHRQLIAYPDDAGRYYIQTRDGSSTYPYRLLLKAVGARWSGTHWCVTDAQRIKLGIERMVEVVVSGCHRKSEYSLVIDSEAGLGNIVASFCPHCDSQCDVVVEQIVC